MTPAKAKLVTTAFSAGLALLLLLAFNTYVVPLAILGVGLYVAWNKDNTVTIKEARLLATTIALGVLYLSIPAIQNAFPFNYTLFILAVLLAIGLFWVPAVWRFFGGKVGGHVARRKMDFDAPPMPRRATAVAMVFLFLFTVMPIVPSAAAAPAVEGSGAIGLKDVPLCNDKGRFLPWSRPPVRVHPVEITATSEDGNVEMKAHVEHQFSGRACMPYNSIHECVQAKRSLCIEAHKSRTHFTNLEEFCVGLAKPDLKLPSLKTLPIDGEDGALDLDGNLCDNDSLGDIQWSKPICATKEGCKRPQVVALLPTSYTVELFVKSGRDVIHLGTEGVDLGDPAGILGAKAAAKKFTTDMTVQNVEKKFADAGEPMPTKMRVFARVTYTYAGDIACQNPIRILRFNVQECFLEPRMRSGIGSDHVEVKNVVKHPIRRTCLNAEGQETSCPNPIRGSVDQLFNGVSGLVDGKVPGVNPGMALLGLNKEPDCNKTVTGKNGITGSTLKACTTLLPKLRK